MTANNGAVFLKMRTALGILREATDDEVSVLTTLIILTIADKPGIVGGDLVDLFNAPKATVSRNVMYLLKRRTGAKGGAGYNLVDMAEDEADRRRKPLYLTPEGQRLVGRLKEVLQ